MALLLVSASLWMDVHSNVCATYQCRSCVQQVNIHLFPSRCSIHCIQSWCSTHPLRMSLQHPATWHTFLNNAHHYNSWMMQPMCSLQFQLAASCLLPSLPSAMSLRRASSKLVCSPQADVAALQDAFEGIMDARGSRNLGAILEVPLEILCVWKYIQSWCNIQLYTFIVSDIHT